MASIAIAQIVGEYSVAVVPAEFRLFLDRHTCPLTPQLLHQPREVAEIEFDQLMWKVQNQPLQGYMQ